MFDSADFLAFARACRMTEPREAAERSAVSRAYYAAFHAAYAYAISRGVRFSGTGDDHERVVTALSRDYPYLSDELKTLRMMRRRADYDLLYPYERVAKDLQVALDIADDIVRRLTRSGR